MGLEWYVFALFHNFVSLMVTSGKLLLSPHRSLSSATDLGPRTSPGWLRHWLSRQAGLPPLLMLPG